ncbi:MAG: MAPEG family protein [Pseudomonadota bacterium]|nr:MAPEG family protein [Pseudomonadota bacterium]
MFAISGFYIALMALLLLVLTLLVVRQRLKLKVALLDGGQPPLVVAIRSHANALEYALPVLLLLLVAEANGAGSWFLHLCGSVFVLARVLHAWGLIAGLGGKHIGRMAGILLTWLVQAVLIVDVLWLSLAAMA